MENITASNFTADRITSKVGNMKVTQTKDSITVQLENSTLEDLKQNLINELNRQVNLGNPFGYKENIELLKVILENEK